MLRFQACEQLLGCSDLTPEMRYQQARIAQKLRNFWTTATLQPRAAAPNSPTGVRLLARTPALSNAMVLTDIMSMFELEARFSPFFVVLEVLEYGGQEHSNGLDYFGLSGKIPQNYLLKHEKNSSIAVVGIGGPFSGAPSGRHIACIPRLIAPYQQLEFDWTNTGAGGVGTDELFLQAGLRMVVPLKEDNSYSYFTTSTDQEIKSYIANNRPETFFMEAQLPFANFPAVGATVSIKTPQQERPLLILGASSNVEGVQAELVDESKYYTFTLADDPLSKTAAIPLYKAPPLALWACNGDMRNRNIYNMWPVPHLLDRGTQLVIRITNGLTPDSTGTFRETIDTRSTQAARITFLCRTV